MTNLGTLVITPAAQDAFIESKENLKKYLARYRAGDWGDMSDEDKQLNDLAIAEGDGSENQIFAAYTLSSGQKIWIITEADRAATTILLPDDY